MKPLFSVLLVPIRNSGSWRMPAYIKFYKFFCAASLSWLYIPVSQAWVPVFSRKSALPPVPKGVFLREGTPLPEGNGAAPQLKPLRGSVSVRFDEAKFKPRESKAARSACVPALSLHRCRQYFQWHSHQNEPGRCCSPAAACDSAQQRHHSHRHHRSHSHPR
jgi:hypothetical protein